MQINEDAKIRIAEEQKCILYLPHITIFPNSLSKTVTLLKLKAAHKYMPQLHSYINTNIKEKECIFICITIKHEKIIS